MDGGRGGGTAGGGGGTKTVLCWFVPSASGIMQGGSSGLELSTFVSELSAAALVEEEEMSLSAGVRVFTCFPTFFLSLGAPVPALLEVSSLEVLGRDDVDEGDEEDLETCTFFT